MVLPENPMTSSIEPTLRVPDSARLSFRLLDQHDAQVLFDVDQDPEVMRYLNAGICTPMEQIEQRMMPRMLAYRKPALGHGIWQVSTRDDCEVLPAKYIGWILVRPMCFFTDNPQPDNLELGWRFKRESWGLGFASEAASAVADAVASHGAMNASPVRAFSALAVPDNLPSIAVMKRLGMQFVSQRVHQDPLWTAEIVEYCKQLSPP
jgi:RimJ/RimL family protein N-acetyltransferase